jgi:hypothetical protein
LREDPLTLSADVAGRSRVGELAASRLVRADRTAPLALAADVDGAIFGVAAEASEGKGVGEAHPRELDAGPPLDVAGAEAHREPLSRARERHRFAHAGEHPVARGVARGHLLDQDLEVALDHRVDPLGGDLDGGLLERTPHDEAVGQACVGEIAHASGTHDGERAHHGAPAGAARGDERAVDVEEQDGGHHR